MPDFEQIIQEIKTILQLIFGKNVPAWVFPLVGWLMLVAIGLCTLWGVLFLLSKIKELWIQNFWPLFYNREQKQRSLHRRYFAEHIESEIIRLGRQEEWKDYRFTELEAEVEAEGQRRIFSLIPFRHRTSSSLRREKSLSKALTSSQERLILVEGEPGSGKSISLRHVAQKMSEHAKKSRSTKSIIPIYINLRELERQDEEAIDRNLIETFVLESLKRIKDRDIDKFLDDEFSAGIENGSWFFLFDSFDEIPEVLSSTESDTIIRNYGNAIEDFLHGMNRCRGIVASRIFHGPKYFGWPRFTIVALSEHRRFRLIRKANLKREIESELIGHLGTASDEIRTMASNPLFLNLLCEHMKNGEPFPQNTHVVFETYINSRFARDELRIKKRFKLDHIQLRTSSEIIAFCMAADTGLGLSPARENLEAAIERSNLTLYSDINTILDALEFMKLARSEVGVGGVQSNRFTFAHRRFQEYFATCLVLREPSLVPPIQLLTNARWRETTVVLCQTQPLDVLTSLIEQADELLVLICTEMLDSINQVKEYVLNQKHITAPDQPEFIFNSFPWPFGLLHLLNLLQEGFVSRIAALPEKLRANVGKLVQTATEVGVLLDKRWALEVAGIVPESILIYLLKEAFSSSSNWLREVAYRQTARLNHITPDIAQNIRNTILELADSHRLHREQHATRAHLMRLPRSADYLSIMRLLLVAPKIDLWVHLVTCFVYIPLCISSKLFISINQFILIFSFLIIFMIFSSFVISNLYYGIIYQRSIFLLLLLMRILIVSFLVVIGLGLTANNASQRDVLLSAYAICFYLMFFAPFSVLAAWTGKFVDLRWWVLLPLWPLLYFITNPQLITSFVFKIRYVSKNIQKLVLFLIIILASVIFAIFLIWGFNYLIDSPSLIEGIILLIVFGIIFIAMTRTIVLGLYRLLQDQLRWQKWFSKHRGTMTCQEFCEAVSFNSWARTQSALRKIRVQHKLAATSETEQFLQRIAFELEVRQRRAGASLRDKSKKENKLVLPINLSDAPEIEGIEGCLQLLWNNRPVVLDEIYMLLEDIRNVRLELPLES